MNSNAIHTGFGTTKSQTRAQSTLGFASRNNFAELTALTGMNDIRSRSSNHFRSGQVQPLTSHPRHRHLTFGMANQTPLQGTFFKSDKTQHNGGRHGTWVCMSTSLPFFPTETTVFKVDSEKKIEKRDKLKISQDKLEFLSTTRPGHKVPRDKYNNTNLAHVLAKNNKFQTAEDDIHITLEDTQFRDSLRPLNSCKNTEGKTGDVRSEEDQENTDKFANAMPPRFADSDMEKWLNKKFQKAIKDRQNQKNRIEKRQGEAVDLIGTLNQNATHRSKLKRRNSRQSLPGFTNVDFNYKGNTNQVDHLIRTARGGQFKHAPSDLNFMLNLRRWKALEGVIEHEKGFQYPVARDKFDPVGIHQGQFKPLKGRSLDKGNFREDYKTGNFNNVRSLTHKMNRNQKTMLQWSTSLRSGPDSKWTWDKSKPQK